MFVLGSELFLEKVLMSKSELVMTQVQQVKTKNEKHVNGLDRDLVMSASRDSATAKQEMRICSVEFAQKILVKNANEINSVIR